jgi:hypothetical protein
MNGLLTAITITGMIFVGTRVLAVDSPGQSTMSKRQATAQITGCMKKRMSANRNSSYNEAMKACKYQITKERDDLASGALVASGNQAKP